MIKHLIVTLSVLTNLSLFSINPDKSADVTQNPDPGCYPGDPCPGC